MKKISFYILAIVAILAIKAAGQESSLGKTVLQWASIPVASADSPPSSSSSSSTVDTGCCNSDTGDGDE